MPSPSTPGLIERPSQAHSRVDTGSKREYRRPAIIMRELVETMAADCNIPGGKNDAACILGFS